MEILYLLIPLSIVLLALACAAFFWAIRHKQFKDMDTAARQILEDDVVIKPNDGAKDK